MRADFDDTQDQLQPEHIQVVVEADGESNCSNRFKKFIEKLRQNQWLSEIDMYSIPLRLNIKGDQAFHTQFAGLVNLIIVGVCLFFTLQSKFPNGFELQKPIYASQLVLDRLNNSQTILENSNEFFYMWFYDPSLKANVTMGSNVTMFAYNVLDSGVIEMEMSTNCDFGEYCFVNQGNNQMATLYGNDDSVTNTNTTQFATLQIEIYGCDQSDPTFWDQDGNSACSLLSYYELRMGVYNYKEDTNQIIPFSQLIVLIGPDQYNVPVLRNQYTTNNVVFGYLSNILSQTLFYYTTATLPISGQGYPLLAPINNTNQNYVFFAFKFVCNGNTLIVSQQFDDITAPILFFLSISQTLFVIAYYIFIKQYNTNSMYLYIADSLVFIKDQAEHRNHNFTSGFRVFLACFLHKHFLINAFNSVLYKVKQTSLKRYLPEKSQLTIEMIQYGEKCMTDKYFFGTINNMSEKEANQLSKIRLQTKTKPQAKEQEEDNDSDCETFFQEEEQEKEEATSNQIKREAFRQMCSEHQFNTIQRKRHFYKLITDKKKSYHLVLMVQELYEEYLKRVKCQRSEIVREISYKKREEDEKIIEEGKNMEETGNALQRPHQQMINENLSDTFQ